MEHAWCLDVARDAAVRAAEDGRTAPLPTLGEAIAAPFACSACGGFGMDHRCRESCGECAPGGMTTERVTLEITTFVGCVPAGWPWREIMGGMAWIHPGESVRVVEEAVGSVDDRAYADRIGCDEERDFANRILAERDAAIRERDAAVAESERRLRLCETMKRDGDSARFHAAVAQARVAELEEARKRFDTALEEARDASGINDFIVQRDEAFDERDAAIRERDELRKSWLRSEESGTRLLAQRNAALDAADGLRKRVAELEQSIMLCSGSCGFAGRSTQAASGGGEGEPVAFGVRMKSGTFKGFLFPSREKASKCAELITDEVVAFFQEPPQPRGWLTGEEREALEWWGGKDCPVSHGQVNAWRGAIRNLLARSSPPEVVLESWREAAGEVVSLDDVRAALAAIGVAVKEVT